MMMQNKKNFIILWFQECFCEYSIKSNIEERYGRKDVLMSRFIFEFKISKTDDNKSMEKASDEALN